MNDNTYEGLLQKHEIQKNPSSSQLSKTNYGEENSHSYVNSAIDIGQDSEKLKTGVTFNKGRRS